MQQKKQEEKLKRVEEGRERIGEGGSEASSCKRWKSKKIHPGSSPSFFSYVGSSGKKLSS